MACIPEFRAGDEESRQAEGRVRGHRPFPLHDRAHTCGRLAQRHRQRIHRERERLQVFLREDLTPMGRNTIRDATARMPLILAVVDDFDIFRSPFSSKRSNHTIDC